MPWGQLMKEQEREYTKRGEVFMVLVRVVGKQIGLARGVCHSHAHIFPTL